MVYRALSLLLVVFASTKSLAADDAFRGSVPTPVERRLEALEAELRELRRQYGVDEAPTIHRNDDAIPETQAPASGVQTASFHSNHPAPYYAPTGHPAPIHYPTVNLTGFFQADVAWFHQDDLNRRTVGDVQDGADFRRARLAATGNVAENVSYMLEMDFGFPGRPSFMDVRMDVHDVPWVGNVRIGQWRQPFGLDALNSVRELTFLERSLPFAFVPFRQIGVGAYDANDAETVTWAASVFRFPTDVWGGNVGDDGGYGFAGRATWLPVDAEGGQRLVHFGFNYGFTDPTTDFVIYRNQPEVFVAETGGGILLPGVSPTVVPFFVDTGVVPAHHSNLFGLEAAAVSGSVHVQSELMYAVVDQIGGPTAVLPGMYVQVGWLLTGETRPYDHANGIFGRIVPYENFLTAGHGGIGGWGAWELAARWSYLDLTDENIRGGRLNDLTFGVNWYLNRYTKFQLNYIRAFLDDPTFGDSNADIIALRAQVDF